MKKLIKRYLQKRQERFLQRGMSTSISDNQAYPQVCLQASHDYRFFNHFRRNLVYNEILEHVSEELGHGYLAEFQDDIEILARLDDYKANDRWGNPRMFDYPKVGTISPTTLRYIKVLKDLKDHFKSLDSLDICEIGVGYGGQCRILNAYYQPATYTLVDINPALTLAQRFLDNYVLHSSLSYKTMNELVSREYDLVISNYAFTELPRTVQEVYLQRIILNSKRGYITYNEITPPEFNSYKVNELVAMLPNAKILGEKPLTHELNSIIVWGMDI